MHPLDDPRLKLFRAEQHLDQFNAVFEQFSGQYPYRAVRDPDLKEAEVRLRVPLVIPPRLRLLLADFAHNARAALDQLAWQLALLTTDKPYWRTEFPIFFENNPGIDERIKDLPAEAKVEVKSFQPYQAGDRADRDLLWALHCINNTDKHRVIPLIMTALTVRTFSSEGLLRSSTTRTGSFQDGQILNMALLVPGYTVDQQLEVAATLAIPFEEVRTGRWGVLPARELDRINSYIRDSIFPRFAQFFPGGLTI